jgi:hypothetical protein
MRTVCVSNVVKRSCSKILSSHHARLNWPSIYLKLLTARLKSGNADLVHSISQTEHEKSRQSKHNVRPGSRSFYRWPCCRTWAWNCDVPVPSARWLVNRRTTFVGDIRRPPPRTRLACDTRGKHHGVLSHKHSGMAAFSKSFGEVGTARQ